MLKNLRPSTEAERLALQEIQSRCQVVVLRCPYETISDPRMSSLIGSIARFKIESYRREYPYGILPFDVSAAPRIWTVRQVYLRAPRV